MQIFARAVYWMPGKLRSSMLDRVLTIAGIQPASTRGCHAPQWNPHGFHRMTVTLAKIHASYTPYLHDGPGMWTSGHTISELPRSRPHVGVNMVH